MRAVYATVLLLAGGCQATQSDEPSPNVAIDLACTGASKEMATYVNGNQVKETRRFHYRFLIDPLSKSVKEYDPEKKELGKVCDKCAVRVSSEAIAFGGETKFSTGRQVDGYYYDRVEDYFTDDRVYFPNRASAPEDLRNISASLQGRCEELGA